LFPHQEQLAASAMSWLTWVGFILLAKLLPAAAISWQNEVNVSICNWAQLRGEF
jgi:hypothetical protein